METKANEKIFIGGGKSEVLLDEATNSISVAGVNVVTPQPGVGDILCRDESGGYRFIRLDTFHAGTFPSAWETLGVVVWRRGNQVKAVSKRHEAAKWMDVFPYVVSGYELDGTEHTAQLRLHGRPSTETFYELRYTASSVDEFVAALQQFLVTNGETDWSAYKDDEGRVILQYDRYESLERIDGSLTLAEGLELQYMTDVLMPKIPRIVRKCGNTGYGTVANVARAVEFLKRDFDDTNYNPSEDVTGYGDNPVCWPAFAGTSQYQDDHCLWLRQRYCMDPEHPRVEEWEAYIDDFTPRYPCMYGGFAPRWRDGARLAADLVDVTYRAADGTRKPLFPAARAAALAFGGEGHIPTHYEFYECFGDVTYGLAGVAREEYDAVNRALYVIGGTLISCKARFWLYGRETNFQAFDYDSFGRFHLYGSPYSRMRALSLMQLDLPAAGD